MKIFNYLLAALFFFFAYVQYNDVDPGIYHNPSSLDAALWLLFYALIGIGFILLNYRRLPVWFFLVAVIACLTEMSLSGPGLWENLFGVGKSDMLLVHENTGGEVARSVRNANRFLLGNLCRAGSSGEDVSARYGRDGPQTRAYPRRQRNHARQYTYRLHVLCRS